MNTPNEWSFSTEIDDWKQKEEKKRIRQNYFDKQDFGWSDEI